MHKILRLDLMVAYSCNLSCAGCVSISDIKRSGIEPFESLISSISKWSTVIDPKVISVFGGEPCLHPQLQEICQQIRAAWPNSIIRLITNGYLLDNFDPGVWFDFSPFEIQVSVHRKDHESTINKRIKNIIQHKRPWVVTTQGGPNQHRQITWSHNNFSIYKSMFGEFIVPYKKLSDKLLPWNSDPAQAHKICANPSVPILYKGLLYKCSPVANIIDITGENWYGYKAVDTTDDLENFVKNIGCPETVCGQCPDLSQAIVINHLQKENVIVRHKNIG